MIPFTESVFDTLVDTNKLYVSMTTKFTIRKYKSKKNTRPLYLDISGNSTRKRIHLSIDIDPQKWNAKKERIIFPSAEEKDINLIIDNYQSKITNIKTVYRLSEKVLTPQLLAKELKDGLPRVNFVKFFEVQLHDDKKSLSTGTYKRYYSVYKKLKAYNSEIIFSEINIQFIKKYRKYLLEIGNKPSTINSNIKPIKKYLNQAIKLGIKIPLDLDDIIIGATTSNRVALFPEQLKQTYKYFSSEFINENHKLILGYFLFSCMTGLRISDIQKLEREQLEHNQFLFTTQKTKKNQVISLNKMAKEILSLCPELFINKLSNEYMNRELKLIFKFLKINKNITFHTARHTFATTFLRMGGKVEKLQILLGHSSIKETMIYVHMIAEEANEEIFLLDNLF